MFTTITVHYFQHLAHVVHKQDPHIQWCTELVKHFSHVIENKIPNAFLCVYMIFTITYRLSQMIEQQTTMWKVAGSNPQADQHSWCLNNRGESAAFAMTSANGFILSRLRR